MDQKRVTGAETPDAAKTIGLRYATSLTEQRMLDMDSSSEVDNVNVSQETYEGIRDLFVCEPRGKIPAKHKGLVNMYFVHGIEPELSEGDDGIRPNATFYGHYHRLAAQ